MVDELQKPKPGARAAKPAAAREAARAEALRANLLRRKGQARSRASPAEGKATPRRGDA